MYRNISGRALRYLFRQVGYDIRPIDGPAGVPTLARTDEPAWVNEIISQVKNFTMTSPENVGALCRAIEYISRSKIIGDIVECGVWRGGSMMAAALALLRHGEGHRMLHLFDTFEGMPPPTEKDRSVQSGVLAAELMERSDDTRIMCYSSLEEVKANLQGTGYLRDRIEYIKGPVEETIPEHAPAQIALLRLDTDWYESTRHELIHLFPRLTLGGVVIIDDYGHWEGAQKAVDEYIEENKLSILLNRIDYTARLAIKT